MIQYLIALDVTAPGDRPRRRQVEAADEHGEPAKQHLFRLGQQGVRPIDRRAKSLLAPDRCAGGAGEQTKAIVQAVANLLDR